MIPSKYNHLLADYPETVTKEQLCRICHISKRKATWLLENGYIPCKDTRKRTRRFTVNMVDIIYYLENRDKHPEKYMTPEGIFSNKVNNRSEHSVSITSESFWEYKRFVENEMKSVPDVMGMTEASEIMMTKNLPERIKRKELKIYRCRAGNMVTKQDLLNSYFEMIKKNRRCYQQFHHNMVRKYGEHCQSIKAKSYIGNMQPDYNEKDVVQGMQMDM